MKAETWEKITHAEMQEAKAQLNRKRAETLSRQAAEIESLDAQLHDIESFERVVAAFFEEYIDPEAPSTSAGSLPERATTPSLPEQSHFAPPGSLRSAR